MTVINDVLKTVAEKITSITVSHFAVRIASLPESLALKTDEKETVTIRNSPYTIQSNPYLQLLNKKFVIFSSIHSLRQIKLVGQVGLVLIRRKVIVDVSLNKPYYLKKSGDIKYYFKSLFQKKSFYSRRHMLLSTSVSGNYFMWICYFLPLALKLRELMPHDFSEVTVWIGAQARQFQIDSLRKLGYRHIHQLDGKPRRLEELVVPSFDYLDIEDENIGHYNILSRKSILLVHSAFFKEVDRDLKIYITRKSANSRSVLNEGEVLERLEGFMVVDLDNMSFETQVDLFNRAKIVVSPHGAGLTNIVFGSRMQVFEFYPGSRPMNNPKNLQICEYLGHEYHFLVISQVFDNEDMHIDISTLDYIENHLKLI